MITKVDYENVEVTQVSERISQRWYLYIREYYSALKKKERLTHAKTGVKVENIH